VTGRGDTSIHGTTVDVQRGMSAVAALRDEWETLAHETGAPVFNRPGWLVVWQRYLVPDASPELLVARNADGALVGVLALARTSRRLQARVPVKVPYLSIAGAGTGSADHNGPVAVDDEVARALFAAAVEQTRGATLYLENLSPRWAQLAQDTVAGTVTRLTECPAVDRPVDGKFSDAWSKKMGKNVRRRHRQMEEEGITSRWVPAGPDFPAALEQLRRVHEGRWNAQGGEGRMSDTRMQFLRDLADECRAPDVPWILLLEHEDRVVAGMLGIVAGPTFSVYKTGWDPDYARFSLGITMGTVAMEWAESQGLTTFDYLRGPRGHKKDLGCEAIADVSVVRSSGLTGVLLEQRERFASDGVRPGWWEKVGPVVAKAKHARAGTSKSASDDTPEPAVSADSPSN